MNGVLYSKFLKSERLAANLTVRRLRRSSACRSEVKSIKGAKLLRSFTVLRSRFSSNRWIQASAWIICALSIVIFSIGFLLSNAQTSVAEDEISQTTLNANAIQSIRDEIKKLEAQKLPAETAEGQVADVADLRARLVKLEAKVFSPADDLKKEIKKIKIKKVGESVCHRTPDLGVWEKIKKGLGLVDDPNPLTNTCSAEKISSTVAKVSSIIDQSPQISSLETAQEISPQCGPCVTNNQCVDGLSCVPLEESSFLDRLFSLLGLFLLVGIAIAMSSNRRKINWQLVGVGIALQVVFGFVILGPGRPVFDWLSKGVTALLGFTNAGSGFLFNSFVTGKTEIGLINFTFAVLPTIIFFSAFMTVLYHLGVMQWVVKGFALVMQKGMRISGAESLSAAANIFVGQTEAPLVIKPYVNKMTMSELMTVMTGGFATVAGGVFAIYVGMLEPMFPEIAGHLLTASVMSAPAALVIGKIMIPETEVPETMGNIEMSGEKEDVNVLDAASRGAAEGLKLALNVAAMLLAFLALLALVDAMIGAIQFWAETPLKLQEILGVPFGWLAFTMGVPWEDAPKIGELFAVKMIVNELVAYAELQSMLQSGVQLSDRSIIIATYALCGFANFGSIGIQLGGIGGIAPDRKADLAKIAFRAMIAGTIAAFMTGTIAGILI